MTFHHYLEVSTEHITEDDDRILRHDPDDWPVDSFDGGHWVWVPEDPSDPENTYAFAKTGLSLAVWMLILYARNNGCNWIRVDQDAVTHPDFLRFTW